MILDNENVRKLLGKTFIDKFDEVILEIGGEQFTRLEMVEKLNCGNFNAAARITKALKRHEFSRSFSGVKNTDPLSILRIKGVGETQMFVLMCYLDYKGYDVLRWWDWNEEKNQVSFATHQYRATKRAKERAV